MDSYWHGVRVAVSLAVNAASGGNPQEMVSSRLYRARAAGSVTACRLCRALSVLFREGDHCGLAWREQAIITARTARALMAVLKGGS